MKKLIVLMWIGLAATVTAEVEYGNLLGNEQSVTLAAGETFILMANNFNTLRGHDIHLYAPASSETFIELDFYAVDWASYNASQTPLTYNANTPNFGTIAGPCRIEPSSSDRYCSYKITRNEVCTSPMNIVALPEDNNGDVELLIETSMDLITWTPVYSGSAGTSNNAAFFRTRLIHP